MELPENNPLREAGRKLTTWVGSLENQKKGGESSRTHGMHGTPTYRVWNGMTQRCLNPKNKRWKDYGGRGITVCERWRNFENFLADMGIRPEDTSIERINNDGNYELGNCKWATREEQYSNMRSNHHITFNDKTQNVSQWAAELGIGVTTIITRLKRGWTVEKTLRVNAAKENGISLPEGDFFDKGSHNTGETM